MSPIHGERGGALDALDRRFDDAQRPDEYDVVRADALILSKSLSGVDAFRAILIAADCLHGAGLAEGRQRLQSNGCAQATELAGAAESLPQILSEISPSLMERFVSLVDVTARVALTNVHDQADEWQTLAQFIESYVPADFAFAEERWGSEWRLRSIRAAEGLATISFLQGDGASGTLRCVAALGWSLDSGSVLTDRRLSIEVYQRAKECWKLRPALVVDMVRLQSAIFEHFDQWRQRQRSRAGRLWIAQQFETLISEFQRDMAEPILPDFPPDNVAAQPLFDLLRERLFLAVEAGKSRLLLDRLICETTPFADPAMKDEAIARERKLLALDSQHGSPIEREVQLVSRLPMLQWQDLDGPIGRADQAAKTADLDILEALYAAHGAGLAHTERVSSLESIAEELGDDEAFIEYAIPRDTLHPAPCIYVLAITRHRLRHIKVPLDLLEEIPGFHRGAIGGLSVGDSELVESSPLGELVLAVRSAIQHDDPQQAEPYLRQLHMLLVAPLAQIGVIPSNFTHWHVAPHGILHAIPFAALLDAEGIHLNDRVALSQAPSASTWWGTRRGSAREPGRFVGIGNPKLDPALWKPLPKTEAEIRTAADRLAGMASEIFVGEEATLEAFESAAPRGSLIHLASHGDFPETDVIDMHRIVLTPGKRDNGSVTAECVRRLDLRGVGLAVLSVCNGGLYRFGAGDELYGLVPAFMEAGAANVLTTLWGVDDGMTRAWMREFYKVVVEKGPAIAAQRARALLISDGAARRDWASFVLIGAG